jgi:hypothetical protein
MNNYDRARGILIGQRDKLDRIAEELLIREVLEGSQVMRIAQGEALEQYVPAHMGPPAQGDEGRRGPKERPSIVPTIPPLKGPLPQE